jgi:hypothetical protein
MLAEIGCHYCIARGGYGQVDRFLRASKLSVTAGKLAFSVGTRKGHRVSRERGQKISLGR